MFIVLVVIQQDSVVDLRAVGAVDARLEFLLFDLVEKYVFVVDYAIWIDEITYFTISLTDYLTYRSLF